MIEKIEKRITVFRVFGREFLSQTEAQEYVNLVSARVESAKRIVPVCGSPNTRHVWKVEHVMPSDIEVRGRTAILGYFEGTRSQMVSRLATLDIFWSRSNNRVSTVDVEVLS